MKSIKALGLSAVMALAMTAFLGVSSASAAEFHAGVEEGTEGRVTAPNTNNHVFTYGQIVSLSCSEALLRSDWTEFPTPTIDATPEYANCTFLGISGGKPSTKGCKYHLNQPTGSGPFTGTFNLECESGGIIFSYGTCTLVIPPQNNLGPITYVNNANGTLSVKANVTGFKYTSSNGCHGEPGTHEDGSYTGTFLASAENADLEAVSLSVE